MGRYVVDFSDVEEFELLPEGLYEGVIDRLEWREPRSEAGNAQVAVVIEVARGESKGREAWQFLSMSPKAKFRLRKFFGLFAIDDVESPISWPDEYDDEDIRPIDDPLLEGEPVEFRVKHRTWNDEKRADVTVTEWLGADEADDDEEEEEEAPPPKKTRKKTAKPKPEPEPEEADDEDDDEEADEEPEEKPKRKTRKTAASTTARATTKRRRLS